MKTTFLTGIDSLLKYHRSWIKGDRLGLVSHAAALDVNGCSSAERLYRDPDVNLTCLMGPEHGFFGEAGAGAKCSNARHKSWGIPIYSLYGDTRKPTPEMLKTVDTILVDLQDIGARCYTYVSTLRYVLEAAAENKCKVIVLDRPVPLPGAVDGPLPENTDSFVCLIPGPMCYGMTQGEAARWLYAKLGLSVDLRVAAMRGYGRDRQRGKGWPPWVPPSPAMLSWESAMCFTATVFGEALQSLDHGRRTNLPFQLLGAKWMKSEAVAEAFTDLKLPGVNFYAQRYDSRPREHEPVVVEGVRLVVVNPDRFKPVLTSVCMIGRLQELYGRSKVWNKSYTRADFFDKLYGSSSVREALLDGEDGKTIASAWRKGVADFKRERKQSIIYEAN